MWELPPRGVMRVPLRLVCAEHQLTGFTQSDLMRQLRNATAFPGATGAVWALPNAHRGMAFPLGTVMATDPDEGGVVSPMACGHDINCGVRLIALPVDKAALDATAERIADETMTAVQALDGHRAAISNEDISAICRHGAAWAIDRGFGVERDRDTIEEGGCVVGADDAVLTEHVKAVARAAVGSIRGGHHFAEIGYVESVWDSRALEAYGLRQGQLTVLIHAGTQAVGRQVLDEAQRAMTRVAARHLIRLPDRTLVCAPVHSHEGRDYLAAMAATANFAFASRQVIASRVIDALAKALNFDPHQAATVWEGGHNRIQLEVHMVDGVRKRVCVHRRSACALRAAGDESLPAAYQSAGQPHVIPGHGATASYLMGATANANRVAFGSIPAVAGLSVDGGTANPAATREVISRGQRRAPVQEPESTNDIDQMGKLLERVGTARRVARLRPLILLRP